MICPSCKATNDASAESCFTCGKSLGTLTMGSVVGNRYEILDYLGRGGMGMIYKAHDRVLDEIVALKTLRPQIANDQDMVRRFVAEIKLARKIRHRNVCAIHDYGQDGSLIYISMEYLEGTDLKKILTEKGPFPPQDAYEIAIQVARGLEAIHEAGIIHRDLKTHNLMRDSKGIVKLLDFGIAKQQDAESGMTGTGQLVGTPEYMSPEQVRGKAIDHRSDLYALGIVIFEAFTGQVPFHGDTPIITLFKHLEEPPPLTGPKARLLPAASVPVIAKMLAKAPADRYASAGDIIEALRQSRLEAFPEALATPAPFAAPVLPDTPSGVVARPAMPTPLPQSSTAVQQARAGATPAPQRLPPVATTPAPVKPSVPAPKPPPPPPTPVPRAPAPPPPPPPAQDLEATIRRPAAPAPVAPPAPPPVAAPPRPPQAVPPPLSVPTARTTIPPGARSVEPRGTPPPPAVPPPSEAEATIAHVPAAPQEAPRPAPAPAPPPRARPEKIAREGGTRTLPAPELPPPAPEPSPQPRTDGIVPPQAAAASASSRGPMIGIAAAAIVAVGIGAVFMLRSRSAPAAGSEPAGQVAQSGPVVQDVVVPSGGAPKAPTVRMEDAEAVPTESTDNAPPGQSGRPELGPARAEPQAVAAPATLPASVPPSLPPATQPPAPRATLAPAPTPPPATPVPTAPPATTPAGPSRAFKVGASRIDSQRAAKSSGPKGFDLGDAAVKSSAEFEGAIDFEFSPSSPRAGDSFAVKIYLDNRGNKDADIKVFTLSPIVNGTRQNQNQAPKVTKVKKGTRVLLYEYTGTWKDQKSWELEAIVTTTKQDVCRNRLSWK